MGGAHYALRAAGVDDASPVHHILFETSRQCRDLLAEKLVDGRTFLSDVADSQGLVGSVLALTDNDCALLRTLLETYGNLTGVLIIGGSPCQGLSRVGMGRGFDEPRSALVWVVPVIHDIVVSIVPVSVGHLLEHVKSMDDADRDADDAA